MARRKPPKSKYTVDRNIPGAFDGETVTRRRFMTVTAHSAGAVGDFDAQQYRHKVITENADIGEVGKTTVYVRRYNPKLDDPTITGRKKDQYDNYVAISTRCMHLGCPVRYIAASERFVCPCH